MATRFRKMRTRKMKNKKALKTRKHRGGLFSGIKHAYEKYKERKQTQGEFKKEEEALETMMQKQVDTKSRIEELEEDIKGVKGEIILLQGHIQQNKGDAIIKERYARRLQVLKDELAKKEKELKTLQTNKKN